MLLNRKPPSQAQHYQQTEDNNNPEDDPQTRPPAIKQQLKDTSYPFEYPSKNAATRKDGESKNDETYYCQYFHATLSNNLFLTNPSTIHFNIDVSVGIYLNVLAIAGKY